MGDKMNYGKMEIVEELRNCGKEQNCGKVSYCGRNK
jgi:hypothetical protein